VFHFFSMWCLVESDGSRVSVVVSFWDSSLKNAQHMLDKCIIERIVQNGGCFVVNEI